MEFYLKYVIQFPMFVVLVFVLLADVDDDFLIKNPSDVCRSLHYICLFQAASP